MAKSTITQVTDDLDGSKDAQEINFSFQGTDYTIDLAKKNLAAFEKVMKPYLDAATKVTKVTKRNTATTRQSAKRPSKRRDLTAIRAWAADNGIAVSERGRVANSVVEQYDAANRR